MSAKAPRAEKVVRESRQRVRGILAVLFPGTTRAFALSASGLIVLGAVGAVFFYRLRAGSGYPLDDSWIHLAFARNLAEGHGFGANPGEPSAGATSPLWILLLSAGFAVGFEHTVWPWLLASFILGLAGVIFGSLVLVLTGETDSRRAGRGRWAAFLCGLAIAWTAPLVWSAAGAMEVPLFVFLVGASLYSFARLRSTAPVRGAVWGVLSGLAALARPEGLLLPPILAAGAFGRWRTRGLPSAEVGVIAAAVVYAPSAIFCLTTGGRLFPNTFYAKTTALVAGPPDALFLLNAFRFFWGLSPVPLLTFGLGLVGCGFALRRRRPLAALLCTVALVLALPVAYASMGRTFLFTGLAGNFGRYLYPGLAPALALGFWAVAWTADRAGRHLAETCVILAAVLAAVSLGGTVQRAAFYEHNVDDINTMQVAMARRLQTRLPAGSLVAANDVGALAYLTDFRVLDLIGIISRPTLDAVQAAGPDFVRRQRACYEVLARERPAAVVVFPQWFSAALRGLGRAAQPIEVIENPRDITSGGQRLVAYRVDWDALTERPR